MTARVEDDNVSSILQFDNATDFPSTTRKFRLDVVALPPTSREWIDSIPNAYLAWLVVCTVLVAAILLLAVLHMYHVARYISDYNVRSTMKYLALLCPVTACTSLIGMYMPRNLDFMKFMAHVYAMACLHVIVTLLRYLFGGRAEMSLYLLESGERVSLLRPPLGCCCRRCLPDVAPTERNLRHLECLITQSPKVRIVLEVVNVLAFSEREGYAIVSAITNSIEVVSMLIAIYGSEVLTHLGQEKMRPCRVRVIFALVNFTHMAVLLQKFVFEMLGKFGAFQDGPELSSSLKAYYWNACTLIVEMFAVSVVATLMLRPRQCAIFNKYGGKTFPAKPASPAVVDARMADNKEHTV